MKENDSQFQSQAQRNRGGRGRKRRLEPTTGRSGQQLVAEAKASHVKKAARKASHPGVYSVCHRAGSHDANGGEMAVDVSARKEGAKGTSSICEQGGKKEGAKESGTSCQLFQGKDVFKQLLEMEDTLEPVCFSKHFWCLLSDVHPRPKTKVKAESEEAPDLREKEVEKCVNHVPAEELSKSHAENMALKARLAQVEDQLKRAIQLNQALNAHEEELLLEHAIKLKHAEEAYEKALWEKDREIATLLSRIQESRTGAFVDSQSQCALC